MSSSTEDRQRTNLPPGTALECVAFAVDGRVDLASQAEGTGVEPRVRLRHRFVYEHAGGSVHIFTFGAAVAFGTTALDNDLSAFVSRCTGRQVLTATSDTHRIVVDPQASRPYAQWDRLVIPRIDETIVNMCALVFARSAGLERYEHLADPLLEQGLRLVREFGGRGRLPWGSRGMLRRMADLAEKRLELARWFVHLDRPDVAWDDPVSDQLYDVMRVDLELQERHEVLGQRMAGLESSLATMVSAWEGRRARALEWAIIGLIAVEIILALLGTTSCAA